MALLGLATINILGKRAAVRSAMRLLTLVELFTRTFDMKEYGV